MAGAETVDQGTAAGHVPADPPDCRDQLRHGVLACHRVIQDRRIQCPARLARQRPGGRHHVGDGLEDAVRAAAYGQPPAPIRQRRMMNGLVRDREATGRFPAKIKGHSLGRFPVRETVQCLQHQDGRDDIGRDRGPAPPGRKQVFKRRHREQTRPVLGKKSEDAARRQQVTGQRLHIQRLPLPIIKTLRTTSLNPRRAESSRRALTHRIMQQSASPSGRRLTYRRRQACHRRGRSVAAPHPSVRRRPVR
jgi:hypothetical protein